jgi:hypothetical protein
MKWATATSRGSLADIHGFVGSVLAVFPGSMYIAGSSPVADMLVVHDPHHGHTPTSVLVDRSNLSVVRPGDPVAARAGYLRAGDLIVDLGQAAVWTPPAALSGAPSAVSLGRSRLTLRERLPATAPEVHRRMSRLLAALADPRDDALESALTRIIGLGAGLTPSGDDAIVGMLGVLHRVCAPSTAATLLGRLHRTVPPVLERTTPISAHYLRLALRGAFSERLTALLDTVAEGPERGALHDGRLDAAIDAVVAVGATSGADALAGVTLTLDVLADPIRFYCVEDVA